MTCRIFLIGPQTIVSQGLHALLQGEPDIAVIGEAASGEMALQRLPGVAPQVIIMDVPLPDYDYRALINEILTRYPEIKLIVLSSPLDPVAIHALFSQGVKGVLWKDAPVAELTRAIHTVTIGHIYLPQGVPGPLQPLFSPSPLSPRERQVLKLLAEGKTTSQIAAALFISIKTVETHRRKIIQKLNLRSVAELTKYAIREGLTTLDE